MTSESTPRKFRCPKCGHKHAADLSPMEGHPEIHGKVPCAECHALMWISLNADGSTGVELYEQHLHEVYEKKATEAVEAATASLPSAAPASGGASGFGMLLAAAVVAAVVSFAVPALRGGGESQAKPAAADPALASRIDGLRSELQAAIGVADKDREELGQGLRALEAALAGHAEALEAMPARGSDAAAPQLAALEAAVAKALANYDELNGRIEANYTNLRLALKRLEALEGK